MKPGDEPPLLTYQWSEGYRPLVRLILFLLLTIAGATGVFLLFKVTYPHARHFSTAPQQVLVLDPAQAATRDIVNRTRDANFLLLSSDFNPVHGGAVSGTAFPVFRPGFTGFEMKLMELPGEQDAKTLPRVYSINDMPLPQIMTVKKARSPAADESAPAPAVLRVVLHGGLAGRELRSPRDVTGVVLADAVTPRFSICVSNTGIVTFALPVESATDARQMRALHKQLAGLRFKPVKAPAAQWGEATFEWEKSKP